PFELLQPRVGHQVPQTSRIRIQRFTKVYFSKSEVARKRASLTFQEHDFTWCAGLRRHVFQYGERFLRFPDLQTYSGAQQWNVRIAGIRCIRVFQQLPSPPRLAVLKAKTSKGNG